MGVEGRGKLNRLQRDLPEGLVVDAAWLERRGYSSALRSKYVAHGWLESVARGVYRRPSTTLSRRPERQSLRWQHVVISLQSLLGYRLAVGGRTALELQGFAHYLRPAGPHDVHLYGDVAPAGWISKLKLAARFQFHSVRKLFRGKTVPPDSLIRQEWGPWDWPLIVSAPERAILEVLDQVPQHETFHQADMLMEGLRNLSPRRLRVLLLRCRSIKVKRLFLWFAERHNHAWLNKLDRKGIDLGSGKRMLARGGRLDRRFHITVPESLGAAG
jgi:hypothetical protein